ncbi:AIM24 family protein, partial [Escherichia coli]|nr:AIM24 family protein [Escherichia coli]
MAIFDKTTGQDPFLHISLNKGETIYAESNAMVMMDATLDLEASMQGGFFSSLIRTVANEQSFFRQKVTANRGDGDILLSPKF